MNNYSTNNYSTSMSVFDSSDFGTIRTLTVNNDPWFALTDVCRALEIGNPSQVASRLDEDALISNEVTDSLGRKQFANFINEPSLYEVIFLSRKAEAKAFKRWITHEVIPAIRKTGGYIAATPDMTPAQIMAQALKIADATLAERDKQIADLKPKAFFADSVANSDSLILVRDLAKILNQSGYKTGGNRLYEQLRQDGYLVAGNS
ncbi:MAG: BRO family protein, partial [Lentisphaeria bacterium]